MTGLFSNPTRIPATLAFGLLVLLTFGPLAITVDMRLSNSAEDYIPPHSDAAVFERELRERFPADELLVAAFEGEEIFEDAFLDALEQVVAAMQRHPLVDRVLSPETLDHISGTPDGFVVEPLLDREIRQRLRPSERLDRMLSDRFAPGLLIAGDGSLLAIAVRPRPLNDSLQRLSIQTAFLEAVEGAGIEGQMVALSGQTALDTAQLLATLRDTITFLPTTLAIGLGLIAWLFRRWLALAAASAVMASSVGAALAFLVIAGHPFTLITAILPPLMVALSVALLIHWFNALAFADRLGARGPERVLRAWGAIRQPALFTALTTAAGLLSLSISPIPPIRALGQAAAIGVLVLYVVVIWILPPIFARWDRGNWGRSGAGIVLLDAPVAQLRRIGMRRPLWVLSLAALLLAVGAPQVAKVQVETDLFRFFKDDHPITQSNILFKERLSGITALEVVFEASYRDAFTEVSHLQRIETFRDWVSERPEVDRVTSLVEMIEEMHWAFHAEDPAYRELPNRDDLIAQYLFIYDGTDLYELVDRDFRTTRILLNLNVSGSSAINGVIQEVHDFLDRLDLQDVSYRTAGFARLFGDQERMLIEGQIRGLFTAVLLIFLLMAFLWRSPAAAGLGMIPNLSPILLIFIAMGAFGLWLDFATAMIAGVSVGIAVDDTIHIYHGYRSRRLAGRSHVWALARTYQHAGRAVTATTLILAAHFLVLGLSQFVPTVEFGLLTALGLVVALVFDLLVLPALLTVAAAWRERRLVGRFTNVR